MEYIIGALTTIFVMLITSNRINKTYKKYMKPIPIRYTQTRRFELISFTLENEALVEARQRPVTQTSKLYDKTHLRVVVYENKAYWIKDNVFYSADIVEDGNFDHENAKVVDIMAMDKVQLDAMSVIVQRLTEGNKNDYRGPGNQEL